MTRHRTPKEILAERARLLARPLDANAAPAGVEMLTFSLGRERFAIPSSNVFAVFSLAELVPLPGATAPVVGLTRWRGDVLTILDLRSLVGTRTAALDDLGRVIVVGDTHPEFGVLADEVADIVTIDPASLHEPSSHRRGDAGILLGVTADGIHAVNAATLLTRQADGHAAVDSVTSTSSSSDQ
jgi:purine-binding chemotaxis protein CheW